MRYVGIMLILAAGVAGAQVRREPMALTAAPAVDTSVGGALRNLASRAGVVFVGQVVAVERSGGVVEVRFSVQQVVQGAVGATFTLHEWAGLWAGGQQRYAVGQRAMWFLNAPNGAGLSSSVDGMEGVVPLVPMGANAAPLLDVRRLATRIQRAVGQPMMVEAVALPEAVASLATGKEPGVRELPGGWRPMPIKVQGQMRVLEEPHAAQ
jgi:hypothetical protein